MAEKKGSFFSNLIWWALGFVCCFFVAGALTPVLNNKELTIDTYFNSLFTGTTVLYAGVVFGIIVLFIVLSKKNNSITLKGKDKMENQRFMTNAELDKTFKNCFYDELGTLSTRGVPFKVVRKGKALKIYFTPDCHTLIVGATGTGKTVSFIEPAIQILCKLKNKPSLFITDVKGELYAHHSQVLVDSGYKLLLLDLTQPYNSLQWNPLENIYDEWQRQLHLEEEILRHSQDPVKNYPDFIKVGDINDEEWYEFDGKAFADLRQALLEVEVEKSKIKDECFENLNDIAAAICTIENEKDPNWEQGARDYFLAVLIAMLEDSEDPTLGMTKERYNFFNAYKIAMNKEDDFEIVKQYFDGRNILSKTRQLSANIVQNQAKTTRDGFMSTLNTKLSMFADNGICFLTSKNDIDFYSMDEQPSAFFIKVPDERATRYCLASVCISQAYKAFVAKARRNERTNSDKMAHLKRPVMYLMDEFANLPKVNQLEKIITVARSRWIYMNMAIQSYTQLDNVYGKEVSSIVRGNCKATIFMGTPDISTRKEFSEELGKHTIEVTSKSEQINKKKDDHSGGPSKSTQLQEVALVHASDLDKIPLGDNYTKMFQNFPIKSRIEPYFLCTDIYKVGQFEQPFIPGRRLNEQEVFYDIRKRNRIVLNGRND